MSARTAAPGARHASRVTALGLAALALLLLPGSLVLYALTGQNLAENGGQDVVVFASCVTVGLIIAWHRPGNPIGWLILAGVDVQGLAIDGSVYETLARRPGYHPTAGLRRPRRGAGGPGPRREPGPGTRPRHALDERPRLIHEPLPGNTIEPFGAISRVP